MTAIEGTAWRLGDDVDTDTIVPGRYLIGDIASIAAHVLEGVKPGFAEQVKPGDIIVAGTNFGTGSSREVAARAIKHLGISAVVAESFSRIFFRNGVNVGLPPVECPGAGIIEEGQQIRFDPVAGEVLVVATGVRLQAVALPEEIGAILDAGGLEAYVGARLEGDAT